MACTIPTSALDSRSMRHRCVEPFQFLLNIVHLPKSLGLHFSNSRTGYQTYNAEVSPPIEHFIGSTQCPQRYLKLEAPMDTAVDRCAAIRYIKRSHRELSFTIKISLIPKSLSSGLRLDVADNILRLVISSTRLSRSS